MVGAVVTGGGRQFIPEIVGAATGGGSSAGAAAGGRDTSYRILLE